jgi:hypothetical protein
MSLRGMKYFSFAIVFFVLCGCAGLSGGGSRGSGGIASDGPMTQARMEILFADQVEAIMGPPGAIQTRIDGINVYLISDSENDRMRLVTPISMVETVDPRINEILLRANFYSTLDARYAISDGVIYGTFLHPISSLSPELLSSALAQVLSLTKTFGSSFSGGELH